MTNQTAPPRELDAALDQLDLIAGVFNREGKPTIAETLRRYLAQIRHGVLDLTAEIERLKAAEPTLWTAPGGTVFDLTKPVYDRDGDEWVHHRSPWSTMAMTDGDLGPRLLGDLFEQYSPLTQEPPKDGAR